MIEKGSRREVSGKSKDATGLRKLLYYCKSHMWCSFAMAILVSVLLLLILILGYMKKQYYTYLVETTYTTEKDYSEEPLSHLPHKHNIRISDRGTLTNLLTSYNGYTLSTGVLSAEMHSGIASIPLDADETMQVGYIMHNERRPSDLLLRYIDELHAIIGADPTVEPHL